MSTKRPVNLNTVYLGLLLFVVAQMLILLVAPRIDPFLEENDIEIPTQPPAPIAWWPGNVTLPSGETVHVPANSALGPILIYIFVAVAVIGVALYKIPLGVLKVLLRLLFALLFSWGAFIATVFYVPLALAVAIGVAFGAF